LRRPDFPGNRRAVLKFQISLARITSRITSGITITSTRPIHISAPKKLLAAGLGGTAALARCWNRLSGRVGRDQAPILILEPFGFGDLISFEPLVRCLRETGREVVLCAKPEWRALFPPSPNQQWLDLWLPWATHNERAKYRFGSYLGQPWRQSLREIRRVGRGAIGIDTRGDIRSVLFLQWAGCRRVLSLSTYLGSNVTVSKRAAELVPFNPRVRRWELNLAFLEPLGLKVDTAAVAPPYFPHLASRPAPSVRAVGLMPVAPWRGKLWLEDKWRQLTGELRRVGCEVRAFCGPRQGELARKQVGTDLEIAECDSVESWARQLTRCAVIVTLDSGPMHLADALGIPVVALFGQGWLPFWAPSGKGSRVLAHQDDPDFAVCHPIEENTPLGQKYMNRITVEEVLASVHDILRARDSELGGSLAHVNHA
jgi:ADP-heptose:LPS heptosyltransferase